MLSSSELLAVRFSKSMGGYKVEEVNLFLEKVISDYEAFENERRTYMAQIQQLNEEVDSLKGSKDAINSVLMNAQRLADQMIEEAKQKSNEILKNAQASIEEITAQERLLSEAFQKKADERREELQRELDKTMAEGKTKAASLDAATKDSVERQQALFDRLKMEVASFKNDITKRYREHLELLQKIPDEVPMDPKTVSRLLESALDETPNIAKFIMVPPTEETVEEIVVSEPEELPAFEQGFVVAEPTDDEEEASENL